MRLLNVHTLEFKECNHGDFDDIPPYIIASHRWSTEPQHEPKYKDVLKPKRRSKLATCPGYKKIEGFCKIISQSNSGIDYLWIDTVCIDQSSSAELHESINSMFNWYAEAECCLAYLEDVQPGAQSSDSQLLDSALSGSEWFRRGWTLQELIAPQKVVFLSQYCKAIGRKGHMDPEDLEGLGSIPDITSLVSNITKIPEEVLYDSDNRKKCDDEEKKNWMKGRLTTRVEDLAYCLLGIFEVFIPLVYGEGHQAHARLLKEIMAKNEADRAQAAEEERSWREAQIDWELLSEERAIDLTHQVSRLKRRGYTTEEAVYDIALTWQHQFGIPSDQATHDIEAYLRAIEKHAGWTRDHYKELRRHGLTRATCLRRMAAELCRSGYNAIDAHRSIRNRLYFKPLSKKSKPASGDRYDQPQVP